MNEHKRNQLSNKKKTNSATCISYCHFTYYRQTGRAVIHVLEFCDTETRAVYTFDFNSKNMQRVHQHDHNMDFENINIIDRARRYHTCIKS